MKQTIWRPLALSGLLLAVAACGNGGGGGGGSATTGGEGPRRSDAFCSLPNFPPSLRQTVVVIDGRELTHADQPEEIRARNSAVIDAVAAIVTRSLAPREQIKIVLAPTDGMQPKLLFTGCLPGYSADELKARNSKSSTTNGAISTFIGQSDTQKVAEALEAFRTNAVGSLVQAARDVPENVKSDAGVPFASSYIVQSLRNGSGLIDLENGVPRVFLLSNLARFDIGSPNDAAEARKAGFNAANEAGLNLLRSELHITLAKLGSAFARDFASAFFLGSQAWLADWGKDLPSNLSNPPVKLANYTGTLDYVRGNYAMQARLATDRNGALVNSWVVLKHDTEKAVPLTGSFNCDEVQTCKFTPDSGGFAQVWSPKFGTGPKPDFGPDLPFGGLRSVEFTVTNGKARGRVFDPSVSQIGDKPALEFQLNECERCRL